MLEDEQWIAVGFGGQTLTAPLRLQAEIGAQRNAAWRIPPDAGGEHMISPPATMSTGSRCIVLICSSRAEIM